MGALEAMGCQELPTGAVQVTAGVRYGHEYWAILDDVREFRPDLLILGAKGWQPSSDAPLGKVARRLIDEASCSIVVVRS